MAPTSVPDKTINRLPEEILSQILGYLDPAFLLKCGTVCRFWRNIINIHVWKLKIKHEQHLGLNAMVYLNSSITNWKDFYLICKKCPFGRNLLKNHCGQDKLAHWKILSSGGNKWTIENSPKGADPLPLALNDFHETFCFATSYQSCSKVQLIDLKEIGLAVIGFVETFKPVIRISEWYAGRFDCGCVYELKVRLLNEKKESVADFEHRVTVQQWEGKSWNKVEHDFKDYDGHVRYIEFYHGGMDTQFWAGHYGSKMSGASVKIILP